MSARLDEIKDHKTLLTAWKIVVSNRRDAKLELAGDGPLKRELELLGASLGIETSVSFLGRIGDMVNKCYAWDLIVHSTTKEEGLGNSMIEAMALGRALVATDVGPVREIAGLEDALLVPPGDPSALASAILHALENDAATKARIARARSTVELKFSSNAMVDAYLQITRCPTARSRKTHHNATAV
jgi:glycosyltransferase involved in cell wall biosynthesis